MPKKPWYEDIEGDIARIRGSQQKIREKVTGVLPKPQPKPKQPEPKPKKK